MRYIEPEITDSDREEIAEQIEKGFTSGVNDSEGYRVTWSIKIEKFCTRCNGTGEVSSMEQVYAGEPHMADVGTQKCECQLQEPSDDMDDDS